MIPNQKPGTYYSFIDELTTFSFRYNGPAFQIPAKGPAPLYYFNT
jgi:hypothetical protein